MRTRRASRPSQLYAAAGSIYGELVKTSCLFIRDLTVVPPVALMLFGGRLFDLEHPSS